MDQNQFLVGQCHVGLQSVAPKRIFKPLVRSAQTMHLSCVEINSISKQTETSFHFTHLRVPSGAPKQFPCPWYIHRKPCTYLESRLMLSWNGPTWVSTWPTSHRSAIGCTQKDFRAYGTFGANHAPIMRWDKHYLQMDRNKLPFHPRDLGVLSGVPKMISMPMVHSVQTVHLSCVEINTH
jgi:hypothetical protein